jgi:Domain of unknown function (DUF4271)
MKFITYSLLFLLSCQSLSATAQGLVKKKDLSAGWMIYRNDQYEPFHAQTTVSVIYLTVSAAKFPGDFLVVKSSTSFSLFINGELSAEGKYQKLPLDSLSKIYSSALTIAIHQHHAIIPGGLVTEIQSVQAPLQTEEIAQRRSWFFRDFAIVGFLTLLVMLIVIIRLNPKLAADYFSITKVFSLRESDESQVYLRITSSTNILFYVFCSLMLGYYLIVIFHFVPARYPTALLFQAGSFIEAIIQWFKLSLILLSVFFLKIILVYGLTWLFGMHEVAGVHFFNWVRSLLVVFGVITIALSIYFIMRGQSESFFKVLLQLVSWILVGWMVLIFLKLSARRGHSMFHLFSYICATELIPFLITIKVLYN